MAISFMVTWATTSIRGLCTKVKVILKKQKQNTQVTDNGLTSSTNMKVKTTDMVARGKVAE